MEFKLNFEPERPKFRIHHGDTLLFLGSCFSDEIAGKAGYHGLKVRSNPFGTVFHPSLLSLFINDSIQGVGEEKILNRNDIFLSWDANSTVFEYSAVHLAKKLQQIRKNLLLHLKETKAFFITFGSAWAYRFLETDHLVANCHKVPGNQFKKELISIDDMYTQWNFTIQLIRELNPDIEIIFTVSPVRHVKDGLIENNQSKAILIELVRRLVEAGSAYYFPSYEIVIDELRDYRFYKKDHVHPSEEAIEYIWRRFESTFCDPETIGLNNKTANFRKINTHKSIHGGKEDQELKIQNQKRLNDFLTVHPEIVY